MGTNSPEWKKRPTVTMNEIFDRILRGTTGNLELRRMVWVPKGRGGGGAYNPPSERLFSRDPRKIERFIKDEAGDVFHGINTRTPGTKTGNKKAVHEIVCFYADIDFKKIHII